MTFRGLAGRVASATVAMLTIVALAGAAGYWSAALDQSNALAPATLLLLALSGLVALTRRGRRRGGTIALLLVGIAAVGYRVVPEFMRPIPTAPAGQGDLTVLDWNVWFDNGAPSATAAAMVASGADVILLQETSGTIHDALPLLAKHYPHRSHCSRRCGLTILSRRPLLEDRYRLRDAAGRPYGPGLAWARTTAPDGGPLTLVTLHYGHSGQAAAVADLAAALRTIPTQDLVLAGDMNMVPWSFAMARQDRALAPLVRMTRALASWPAQIAGWPMPAPLVPIDHLFAGTDWRLVRASRLRAAGSDHYGILVRLQRTPPRTK